MRWLWIILTALLIIGLGPLAFGQDYPTRPSRAVGSTPDEFRKLLHADVAKWSKIVKDSGAKVD